MVKPVFKALFDIKAQKDPEVAKEIALTFLSSPDAAKVNASQAGTFLIDTKAAFIALKSPLTYGEILEEIVEFRTKSSTELYQQASFAKIDFDNDVRYIAEMSPVMLDSARMLKGITSREKQNKDGNYVQHESPFEVIHPAIGAARSPEFLKVAINDTLMLDPDVTDEEASDFLRTLTVAFRKTGSTVEQQIDMLSMVADLSSTDDLLHHLANQKAVDLVDTADLQKNPVPTRTLDAY